MPNIWFTADFHFGHSNIIRYCNRPFQIVEEMDRTILDRLNDSAKANDILYFLGDFCIGSKAKAAGVPQADSLQEDLCGAGKSRQTNSQADRGVLLAQQLCGNLHTWPTHRDLSLRHAGLKSLPSWSVAPVRTFSWEPP